MDAANRILHRCPSDNAKIDFDGITAAVAGLNKKILQLRREIEAFKDENKICLVMTARNCARPSGFNDSTKNGKRRTSVQYELQRNFKGYDSPDGTDLSARLSFAKRAREVKAANEAAVFKEDYPRDDKSIEDDERPNRSRVSEPSGAYRKYISDAEKFEKEIGARSGDARDDEDVRTLFAADEKSHKSDECRYALKSDICCNCSARNGITTKIRRKKISRGVQYDVPVGRSFGSCCKRKSDSKKYRSAARSVQEINKKKASVTRKKSDIAHVKPQNEMKSLNKEVISNNPKSEKFHNAVSKEGKLIVDTDFKKEKSENDEVKVRDLTDTNNDEERKENDNLRKDRKVKVNLLKKLWSSTRNKIVKMQGNRSRRNLDIADDSQSNREQMEESDLRRNEKTNSVGEDNVGNYRSGWSAKIFDGKAGWSNARRSAAANSNGRSDVSKLRKKLDWCIAELNEMIADACAVFGGQKSSGKAGKGTADSARCST